MKWFGEDGRLLALPDPTKEISSRPPIVEDAAESAIVTRYISVSFSLEYSHIIGDNMNGFNEKLTGGLH
jgi:Family of unknown function (DUF5523)